MSIESKQLTHLRGKPAYVLYWEQVYAYRPRPRLSTVETIDLNLEIIIDANQRILAFRHDLPDDMVDMVLNAGHWSVSNRELLCPDVLNELNTLMRNLRKGICWN